MRWFVPKTLLATLASVILPLLALAYLAGIPGKKTTTVVVIQLVLVIGGVIFFGMMLARLVEQVYAARVGRWLKSAEGQEWLESLPEDEREAFESRFDGFR